VNEPETPRVPASDATYLIGTSGWTYDDWKGTFYPAGLPRSRWFEYYASRFHAVEVNATFYRAFKDQTYLKWKEQAPEGFGYVLKAPRVITHRKYLVDAGVEIGNFCRSASLLGERLEMILLQVAPQTPVDLQRLDQALRTFPDPGRVAFEFRKPAWYTPEVCGLLRGYGAAFVNVDSPRQELTSVLTSPRAYLRLHGRQRWYEYDYSPAELREIARLARELAERGAEWVYIFFNNSIKGFAPANALALRDLLGA